MDIRVFDLNGVTVGNNILIFADTDQEKEKEIIVKQILSHLKEKTKNICFFTDNIGLYKNVIDEHRLRNNFSEKTLCDLLLCLILNNYKGSTFLILDDCCNINTESIHGLICRSMLFNPVCMSYMIITKDINVYRKYIALIDYIFILNSPLCKDFETSNKDFAPLKSLLNDPYSIFRKIKYFNKLTSKNSCMVIEQQKNDIIVYKYKYKFINGEYTFNEKQNVFCDLIIV